MVAQGNPQSADDGPGTAQQPWKTFGKAAATVAPGDTVLIAGGVYRERVTINANGTAQSPIRFVAVPGEHVVLTGADRLTGWKRTDVQNVIYSIPWPHRFNTHNKSMTHPDDEYHQVIGRCEQVFVNGYALRQVLSPDQLAPGTFYVDIDKKTLSVWDAASQDPNKALTEASVRQDIMRIKGAHVRVRGIHFRYAANAAQHGAVVLAGPHDVFEDCIVEDANASGAAFQAADIVVRRCVFRDNGQLGFGANRAHRLLVEGCLVENNNTKNFARGWEAGGNKLVLCDGATLIKSRFVRNRGNGIWFDIGNENCVVAECLIADNEDAGIFYEISYGLRAHDNVIIGNGFAQTAGAWGAQAGICLSSSPGCLIERNLLAGNREGVCFREQLRSTPTIAGDRSRAVWNHDELIRNNLIVFNRDAQVWGWFDVPDDRAWPATGAAKTPSGDDSTVDGERKGNDGQPHGLTLDQLNLRFEGNVYVAGPGQGWFNWGPTWKKHERFERLAEFQSALRLDSAGRVLDPGFADMLARDFRMKPHSMESLRDCYPRESVPGVILGAAR